MQRLLSQTHTTHLVPMQLHCVAPVAANDIQAFAALPVLTGLVDVLSSMPTLVRDIVTRNSINAAMSGTPRSTIATPRHCRIVSLTTRIRRIGYTGTSCALRIPTPFFPSTPVCNILTFLPYYRKWVSHNVATLSIWHSTSSSSPFDPHHFCTFCISKSVLSISRLRSTRFYIYS